MLVYHHTIICISLEQFFFEGVIVLFRVEYFIKYVYAQLLHFK